MRASRVRPVIVLGPERSGTSALAELIATWGAYPGERDDLPEPDHLNPQGRWEYGPLWDLLERIGGFADGVSWWDESFPAAVAAKTRDQELRAAAVAMIEHMQQHGQPWVWKDPALCHFLPFWRQIWHEPVYVIAVRHPLDVARSWQQFAIGNGHWPTSIRCNLLRWQYMASRALQETADSPDRLFVEYEQLAKGPGAQAVRLARFLDSRCRSKTSEAVIAQMTAACDGTLWRNRDGYQHANDQLAPGQAHLYSILRWKAADATGPARMPAMPENWRSIVTAEEADPSRAQ